MVSCRLATARPLARVSGWLGRTGFRPGGDDGSKDLSRNHHSRRRLQFTFANTGNLDSYQRSCRERGIPIHPARMPEKTAEFFIRFLSEPASWERLGLKSSTAHRRRSWIREERRAKGYDVFEIAGSDLDDRDAMARHF